MSRKLYLLMSRQDGEPVPAPVGVLGADDKASFVSWLPGATPGFLADFVSSVTSSATPVESAEELTERANGITWDVSEVADAFPAGSLSDSVFAAIDEILATPGS